MTSMREKMIEAAVKRMCGEQCAYPHCQCGVDPMRAREAVDAILSVLEEPSDGVRDVGMEEYSTFGGGIVDTYRAMIRAIRNGA